MINGMEILKQTEIVERVEPWFFWPLFIILAFIAGRIGGKIATSGLHGSVFRFLVDIFAGVGLMLISLFTLQYMFVDEVPTGRYTYEVIIEDTSVLKEVYEHYDIIDVKGDIYILEDKQEVQP